MLPAYCLICESLGSWLCPTCESHAIFRKSDACLTCGRPAITGALHSECATRNSVDGWYASCFYGQVEPIVRAFKYLGVKSLSEPIGRLMCEYLKARGLTDFFSDAKIVPLPLHPTRRRERGYNQSELLAEKIGRGFGLEIRSEALVRVRYSEPQMSLPRPQRLENVRDAYRIVRPELVKGQKILLIDDVATTGATINECARQLKSSGAAQVWAYAFAHG